MKFGKKLVGHIGAFAVGMGFGAGLTPCIGSILASMHTYLGGHHELGLTGNNASGDIILGRSCNPIYGLDAGT